MTSGNGDLPAPEDLVERARDPGVQVADQVAAANALEDLFRLKVRGRLAKAASSNVGRFLAAAEVGSIDDLCDELIGNAIMGWDRGGGASFSTYLYRITSNAIFDIARAAKRLPIPVPGPDDWSFLENFEDPSARGDTLELLIGLESAELACACVLQLDEPYRTVFILGALLERTTARIQEILPDESVDNIRKIKQRAIEQFGDLWREQGGNQQEDLSLGLRAMVDRLDPDRIGDPRARRAFELWMTERDFAVVAEMTGMSDRELHRLLRIALRYLFCALMSVEASRLPLMKVCSESARLDRTLAFVRAALGITRADAVEIMVDPFIGAGGFLHRYFPRVFKLQPDSQCTFSMGSVTQHSPSAEAPTSGAPSRGAGNVRCAP